MCIQLFAEPGNYRHSRWVFIFCLDWLAYGIGGDFTEYDRADSWICDKCKEELKPGKVKATYLGGSFEVELMRCPRCGNVFISEDLALGKMLEVEKELEDK